MEEQRRAREGEYEDEEEEEVTKQGTAITINEVEVTVSHLRGS